MRALSVATQRLARFASSSRVSARSSIVVNAAPKLSPTRSASVGASAPPVDDDPTYVPRNQGIKDGTWTKADIEIVQAAKVDADKVAASSKPDSKGYVLLGKSLEELEVLVAKYGQPKYRAKQLMEGVYKGAHSVLDIPTVPKALKEALEKDGVRTGRSILHHTVRSEDGTTKLLLQLADGRVVETVGIPVDDAEQKRLTVCVSSQVGCPMRCTFCATGKGGFARNLTTHEIVDQVMAIQELFGKRVSNVVFMGMGEPLLNLPNVSKAYELINKELEIGGRYITISTVGVPNAITRLAETNVKSTLAVSIHAPNQELREKLIPSAKAYPLSALMEECVRYYKITGRRVTFEYTLMAGMNDQDSHALELAKLLRQHDLLSHINIIPWNPVDESDYQRPSRNRVFAFKRVLETEGLPVSIRQTRGLEAAAACGQLRNRYQKEPLPEFAAMK